MVGGVPNWLSLSRLPLAAGLAGCVAAGWWGAALAVFAVAAATDFLDGWWARTYGPRTAAGRTLDPLTDKVLLATALVYLVPVPGSGVGPGVVAVVVGRELLVTGLRGLVEAAGVAFAADRLGKLKTGLQFAAVAAVFAQEVARPLAADWFPAVEWGRAGLVGLMLAATVVSGANYVAKALPALR